MKFRQDLLLKRKLDSLRPHGLESMGIFQGRIVDSLSLLQGIFPTQGSNPGLLHCRQILYQLSHKHLEYIGDGLVTKLCLMIVKPRTVACQVPLSIGFSRQECWSGLPFPSLRALPDPGIEPGSSSLQADSLSTKLQGKLFRIYYNYSFNIIRKYNSKDLYALTL